MTRNKITSGLGLFVVGLWLGVSLHCFAAPAVPVKPTVPIAAGPSMADLLTGKLYPNTVKRSELIASYHLVSLIDAQGKPAVCATQGAMLTLGGETFLVAYLLPPPTPTLGAATPAPAPPPADADAQLTLINMRYVQALGGIRDVSPPTEVSAPPAAPSTAPLGTAAP